MKRNFVHLLAVSPKNAGIAIRSGVSALMAFTTIAAAASTVQFKPAQSYAVGANPVAAAISDFNKDGKPDLAVLNYGSNNVTILLGQEDGTFRSAGNFGAAIPANSLVPTIAVGDFNGDGKLDVAILLPPNLNNYPSELHILLGNGDGTLQAPIVTILDVGEAVAAVADINGDKKADLIMSLLDANNAVTGVAVLLGNGDGSFQAPKTVVTAQLSALTVADLNADGKPDLAISNSGTVQIMLGHGDGTFSKGAQAVLPDGSSAGTTWVADLNADGNMDLIVMSQSETCGVNYCNQSQLVSLFPGREGMFGGEQDMLTGYSVNREGLGNADWIGEIAIGDFNGDGRPDIAARRTRVQASQVVGRTLAIYLGNGDGVSSTALSLPDPGPFVAVVDLNSDQLADLVALDSANNSVDVLLNATPAFSLTASTNALTANAGEQVTDTLSLTGVNGFSSTLQLSCQVVGPAPTPTCSLSPASITAGASASVSTLTIGVPATAALLSPHTWRLPPVCALAFPFAFVGLGFRRKRVSPRHKRWLLEASLATAALLCTGCGGGGNSNTQSVHQPQSYMVQVTAASDSLTKAMQISLTVQ